MANPPGSDREPVRYAVDVRLFLAVITTAMALAFGAGVAFGPTGSSELAAMRLAAMSPPASLPEPPTATESRSEHEADDATEEEEEEGTPAKMQQTRRAATAHSAELGPRIVESDTGVKAKDGSSVHERHVNYEEPSYENLGDGTDPVRRTVDDHVYNVSDDDEEEHLPQGQHLLVDIKNVEAAFLNSEDRLAAAMVDVVRAGGLTLLSYHCHSLTPAGVSCVGVLLESHISFHTWPDEGVITLDLFTCGNSPLLPVIPVIEEKFGPPRLKADATGTEPDDYETIKTLWAHELRGFRHPQGRKKDYLDDQSDLAFWITSSMDMEVKKQIVSTVSPYQRIDIWDVLDIDDTPSYKDAIKHNLSDGDPRWLTNEIASPERLLFLDGTLQSLSESEQEYHEALVHPAMFAHPDPKNVAIVGGGEGATLREVLKHATVEHVVMIELDEMMVDIAREHLPFMSDCSDLVGSTKSCFDDARASVLYEDGKQWFFDRYGESKKVDAPADAFDVIVLDALDPEDDEELAGKLYTDETYLTRLFQSMSDDGVLVIQVGTAPSIHDPRADLGVYASREELFQLLESHPDTAAMFVYEEAHCGFLEPHSFLVVCKSSDCRKRWYAESDAVDFSIYERIVKTESGDPALVHFDGSTLRSYQVPPKAWETVYCRREPEPFECAYRGLDLTKEVHDFEWYSGEGDAVVKFSEDNSFEVKTVKDEKTGEEETRVYATKDIAAGSYVMPEDLASSFAISDDSLSNLKANTEIVGTGQVIVIEDLLDFVDVHGHRSMAAGSGTTYVEVGGTFMMRRTDDEAKANVGMWMPPHPSGKIPVYSPVYERHMMSFDVFMVATRDIGKGEEVVKHERIWRQE